MDLRDARAEAGLAPLDWLVVPNRKRPEKSRNRTQVESALVRSAEQFGFRLGEGLSETVAFRELVQLGLTHFDLGRIPQFAHRKPGALAELARLLGEIDAGAAVSVSEAVA
jgi:chromosome partitioning protein